MSYSTSIKHDGCAVLFAVPELLVIANMACVLLLVTGLPSGKCSLPEAADSIRPSYNSGH